MKSRHTVKKYDRWILVIFVLSAFLCACAGTSVSDTPAKDWKVSSPEAQGMRSQMLAEMIAHIKKNSIDIDSILIVRNGHLVLDAYFWPFSKGQKHIIHSCTKSIMSALIGIAKDKGYIQNVDQPITDFFPDMTFDEWDDLKKSITLENLLMMASGLKCRDSYLYRWTGLFEMRKSPDWAQYVLDLPMAEAPGEKFVYCNGASYLLSVIIQNTTNMKTLDFARKHLFEPLGVFDVGWATSPQGVDIGYGEMWLQPHDMARFGWLYLNKGRWGNRQIIPSEWVAVSTSGHIDATLFDLYGYQWWVDSAGYYMAVGYKGQRIFVVPQKNMVVVFTGDLTGSQGLISKNLLDFYIIPAAVSTSALPPSRAEQARLDTLVKNVAQAPPSGLIWTSANEGVAKEGIFRRSAPPAFSFDYPRGSKKAAIDAPDEVMRMKTPGDIHFSASVGDIPKGMRLEDFGPERYVNELKNFGSQISVVSNKEVRLKCGTKAYRTDISWLWRNTVPIKTVLVSGYKDDKYIFVSAHPWKNHQKVEPIFQSLTFK